MKNVNTIDRRAFLRRASSTALTLPLIGLGVVELTSCAGATSGTVLTNSDPVSWKTSRALFAQLRLKVAANRHKRHKNDYLTFVHFVPFCG
jgi:hypothetical protein